MFRLLASVVLCTMLASVCAADDKLPRVFEDNFEKGAERWQPSDPAAWKIVAQDGNHIYCQFQQSKYKTLFRSPFNFALVKDLSLTDLVLEAKVKSTTKDYDHRDVCLFFGYQGPARYYYAHLGKKTDDRANQIFIVNNADRVKISTKTTPGTPWTDSWHNVKVVRKVESGAIEIYFDDMKTPAMVAQDRTFTWGQVGVGSFDDTSCWDDVKVYGTRKKE
jgi:hypothetical protein